MAGKSSRVNQCQNPAGWLGRLVLRNMNSRHSKVTDWGLSHASIGKQDIILDVGCGGGRTVSKLAAIATQGKVYGIDHSKESVAMAMRTNKRWIDIARVEIRLASVSCLPFSDGMFNVVTAVETHFWWPALPTDLREVLRVLQPRGRLIIIAVVYKGAEALGVKRCRTMLCTYWDSSVLRIIANSSAMPVTQTLRSLHNRERAGFPASGVRPQVS